MKIAKKTKITNSKIDLSKPIENELPFTSDELLNIFKIIDVALADEKIESEIKDWMKLLYNPISSDSLESLHKKVHFYLLDENELGE